MKESQPLQIDNYVTTSGKEPFKDWLFSLELQSRARVAKRIKKIRKGNEGDKKSIEGALFEYRFKREGFRIYAIRHQRTGRLLLLGGSKGTQNRDIKKAKALLQEYKSRE